MSLQHEHELTVITKGKELVKEVYILTRHFPDYEKFGLASQMQRAAVSIPSNLAEGQQRGDKEFLHFINIARGSLFELKIQVDIAKDLYYQQIPLNYDLKAEIFKMIYLLIDEIGKMTYRLMLKLRADAGV